MKFLNRADKNKPLIGDDGTMLQAFAEGRITLDPIHSVQYFQGDVSENNHGGLATVHRTFNVPIPKTLVGTIYFKGVPLHAFAMDDDRKIHLFVPSFSTSSPVRLIDGQGYDTGIIVMNWSGRVESNEVRLFMHYEYSIEDSCNELHFNS